MFIHNTKYYTYLGTHYHKSFPLIWAMKNKAGTGIYCENCICYATEKNFWGENVHMGYCLNCAEHIYENRRKWYQNKEGIKEIIPELLQSNCNPKKIFEVVSNYLDNPKKIDEQISKTQMILKSFRTNTLSSTLAANALNKYL